MTLDEFRDTLNGDTPPVDAGPALQALWFDGKGDWHAAHEAVQNDDAGDGAWVHAYLHRKEGDASNAAYWYRRAGKPVAAGTLNEEWAALAEALLSRA